MNVNTCKIGFFYLSENEIIGNPLPVFTKTSLNGTGIAFCSVSLGHKLKKTCWLTITRINAEEKRAALFKILEDSFSD